MEKILRPNMKSVTVINLGSSLLASSVLAALAYYSGNLMLSLISFVTVFALFFITTHFSYKSQEYTVSEDEIEFYEGFINIEKRNIAFDKITDVKLEQSIEQRYLNTGDIKINTAGTSTHEVILEHLDSPEEVYKDLRAKANIS